MKQSRTIQSVAIAAVLAFLAGAVPASAENTADRVAWEAIVGGADSSLLEAFVHEYPTSPYRAEAEARLAAIRLLRAGVAPVAATPTAVPAALAPAEDLKPETLPAAEDAALTDKPEGTSAALEAAAPEAAPAVDADSAEPGVRSLAALPPDGSEPDPEAADDVDSETGVDDSLSTEGSATDEPADAEPAAEVDEPKAKPTADDREGLVRSIQTVLDARGCRPGDVTGRWTERTRQSAWRFLGRLRGSKIDADTPSIALYEALESAPESVSCTGGAPSAKATPGRKPVAKAPPRASERTVRAKASPRASERARAGKARAPRKERARKRRGSVTTSALASDETRVVDVTPGGAVRVAVPPQAKGVALKPIVSPEEKARLQKWIKQSETSASDR